MKGFVHLDNAFEDVDFPAQKCLSVRDVARSHVGIHHAAPRRMRALWKAYQRVGAKAAAGNTSKRGGGRGGRGGSGGSGSGGRRLSSGGRAVLSLPAPSPDSAGAPAAGPARLESSARPDPSRPQMCMMSREGNPYHHLPWALRAKAATLPRPVHPAKCKSILDDPDQAESYPHCIPHIRYVQAHSKTSPCNGPWGRYFCEGFQLDRADTCNVQYYLFCERLYKIKTTGIRGSRTTWCPSPEGYPQHCCYGSAVPSPGEAPPRKQRPASTYLLQVYPDRPVWQPTVRDDGDEDDS